MDAAGGAITVTKRPGKCCNWRDKLVDIRLQTSTLMTSLLTRLIVVPTALAAGTAGAMRFLG